MKRLFVVLTTIIAVAFFAKPSLSELKLDVTPNSLSPGQEVTVSCFASEALKSVTVTFVEAKQKVNWPTLSYDVSAFEDSALICIPPSSNNFGVFQKCGNSSGVQLRLRPSRYNGGEVKCQGKSNTTNEIIEATAASVSFKWSPSAKISGASSFDLGALMEVSCRFEGIHRGKSRVRGIGEGWSKTEKNFTNAFGIITSVSRSFRKIATTADNGTLIECGIGRNSTKLRILVTDRSVRASLKGLDKPVVAYVSQEFYCGQEKATSGPAVVLVNLTGSVPLSIVRIYHYSEFLQQTITSDFFQQGSSEAQKWKPITDLPADSDLQPSANKLPDRLQLTLSPKPRHNGAKVICEVTSTLGGKNQTETSLQVTWSPSIRRVRLQNAGESPITSIPENKIAIVNCSFSLGKRMTLSNDDVTITKPNGADLKPVKCKPAACSWKDQDGFEWRTRLWNATFDRQHNGEVIRCALDDQSSTLKLNITYPPRITNLTVASASVGSPLICSADANPPPNILLQLLRRNVVIKEAKGKAQAEITVPKDANAGSYKLRCEAKNGLATVEKKSTLNVTKLPLNVTLKFTPPTFDFGIDNLLSCSSSETSLQLLELKIHRRNLIIVKNITRQETYITIGNSPLPVSNLPFSISKDIILMRSPLKEIRVSLNSTPIYNGTAVSCRGASAPDVGKAGYKQKLLTVQWAPSVRSIAVASEIDGQDPNAPIVKVEEEKPTEVSCEAQMGFEKRVNVTAKIGNEELLSPAVRPLDVDADGFHWKRFVWKVSFSRDDAEVECFASNSSKKTAVVVLWKPQNTTLNVNEEDLSVKCNSLGKPTPIVNLTVLNDDSERINNKGGEGSVTLDFSGARGNITFICIATNSIDSDEAELSWFVPPFSGFWRDEHNLKLLIIVGASVGAAIILTLVLYALVKKRAARSASGNLESPNRGNNSTDEVLLDTRS